MDTSQLEQQVRQFLKRASDELKRTSGDLRTEAQRLLEEVRKPENQQRLRDNLQDIGGWARRTASQAADLIDNAVQKLDASLRGAVGRAPPPSHEEPPTARTAVRVEPERTSPSGSAASESPGKQRKTSGAKKKPAKSIGRKKE